MQSIVFIDENGIYIDEFAIHTSSPLLLRH